MNKTLMAGVVVGVMVLAGGAAAYVLNTPEETVTEEASVAEVANEQLEETADIQKPTVVPSCTLATDKKYYDLGEKVRFSWKSSDAISTSFNNDFQGPPSSSLPPLPQDSYGPNGSVAVDSRTTGYFVVQLQAKGGKSTGHCETIYFVGSTPFAGQNTEVEIAMLPASIQFEFMGDRATYAKGSWTVIAADADSITNSSGATQSGHALILVKDDSSTFPVYLVHGEPQSVVLSSGKVFMTARIVQGTQIQLSISQ